jgi:hypothetical protein
MIRLIILMFLIVSLLSQMGFDPVGLTIGVILALLYIASRER